LEGFERSIIHFVGDDAFAMRGFYHDEPGTLTEIVLPTWAVFQPDGFFGGFRQKVIPQTSFHSFNERQHGRE
jgi:hypothetical protein